MKDHKKTLPIKAKLPLFSLLLVLMLIQGAININLVQNNTVPSNADLDNPTIKNLSFKTSESHPVYCTGNFFDMAEDLDGDNLYDHVVLIFGINATQIFLNLSVVITIQPLMVNQTPIGEKFVVTENYVGLAIGIHNLRISLVNASRFHNLGQDLMFNIHKLRIIRYHELMSSYAYAVFTDDDLYTTQIYLKSNFEIFVRFTGQIWDRGEDDDFNWRYDYLVVEIEVDIIQAGKYSVEMNLVTESSISGKKLTGSNQSSLKKGLNIISIRFAAESLRELKINGSLVVTNIIISDNTDVIIFQTNPNFITQKYSDSDFDIHLIRINGNNEFTLFVNAERLRGVGSPLDPYIISGFSIMKLSSQNYFIHIKNVDVFFQITNNFLHNGKTAIFLENVSYCLLANNNLNNNKLGISLINVNECVIRDNSIINHDTGISLIYADNNVIKSNTLDKNTRGIKTLRSNNNVIVNNSISGKRKQTIEDIGLVIGTSSEYNLILHNDFQNNYINAIDLSLNNVFESNFWNDSTDEDYYRIPDDISGVSTNNYDRIPSKMPNHMIGPKFISPSGGACLDSVVKIIWLAYDTLDHALTYEIYISTKNNSWSLLTTGLTLNYFEWDVRNVTDGQYKIKIVVYDSLGFSSWEISDWITIQTPINPTNIVSPFIGMIILIIVCSSLLIKTT